jgi:hypothetical protein
MGRKLPRNFRKAKPKTCRVIFSGTPLGSVASKSACQLLERLIVLELRDVLDRCDGDVQ